MNINSYENITKAIKFSDKKALIKELTGFNPNFYNPDVNDMMMVGVIDLKDDKEDVYEAIKEKYEYEKKNNIYYKKENIIFFEDEYNKIWLIWMGK
ncbi:hypothetical protein SAMN02910289_00470 [Lachnospiraceae bacterium RM5]|nr:hypothetical protein SAMN02910289_00470 [Lachnospiraceae bacterium RM5]